jgi:CrcB protein
MTLLKGAVFALSLIGVVAASLRLSSVLLKASPQRSTEMLVFYILISLGSGIGGVSRFACTETGTLLFGNAFSLGLLIVNGVGSFILGFFFTFTGPDGRFLVSSGIRHFVMTGLCGGYTSFSSFSLDTLNLMRDGRVLAAGADTVVTGGMSLVYRDGPHVGRRTQHAAQGLASDDVASIVLSGSCDAVNHCKVGDRFQLLPYPTQLN